MFHEKTKDGEGITYMKIRSLKGAERIRGIEKLDKHKKSAKSSLIPNLLEELTTGYSLDLVER